MGFDFYRPALYPKQFAAIYEPKRISAIEASTKAGKTFGCIIWLLEQAWAGRRGMNYWWVAPISEQAGIAFRRMCEMLAREQFLAGLSHPQHIRLKNGAIIWFKSGDKPNSLYGEDVHAAVVDEASRAKPESWTALRSTLTYTRGPVRLIGNVHGRKNWFYRIARRGEEGDAEIGYHKITAYDAAQAGVLAEKEIEDARSQMPEQDWRELFLAEPADDGGNPFGLGHIRACVVENMTGRPPVIWGWDLAKRQDYTVGCALDREGYLCGFERFQGVPWPNVEERILELAGNAAVLVDSTGVGDPILDHLQKEAMGSGMARIEGYHFTPSSKQKLMEGLARAIQSREVHFPDGPIRMELEQFEYEFTRTAVRYSAPEGLHDDCVIALALAVQGRVSVPAPLNITEQVLRDVSAYHYRYTG